MRVKTSVEEPKPKKSPGRPKKGKRVGKVEIRADADWIERLDRIADRLALDRSAYIRMVVSQAMDAFEGIKGTEGKK